MLVQEAFWVVGQCEPSDHVPVAVTVTLVALVLDKYVVVGSCGAGRLPPRSRYPATCDPDRGGPLVLEAIHGPRPRHIGILLLGVGGAVVADDEVLVKHQRDEGRRGGEPVLAGFALAAHRPRPRGLHGTPPGGITVVHHPTTSRCDFHRW